MKFAFVLLSIFFLFFGNSKFKGGTHAILTGNYVPDIRYANFMLAIHIKREGGDGLCGGAIFSSDKFVTAAHCLHNITSATVTMVSLDPDDDGVTEELERYVPHPDWQPGLLNYDIAVGFLPIELEFDDYINEIGVVEQNYTVDENLAVVAYGYGVPPAYPSNNLRWTATNVMNFQTCSNRYSQRNIHGLDENVHFCLGPTRNRINHIYNGDSGGPIIDPRTRKLVGIIKASAAGLPDVCLKIAGFREFLADPDEFIRNR